LGEVFASNFDIL